MPSSSEIRQQFLDFFVERCGHTEVPSAPVVPHDDPTLLFTNAGMNQFKDVFLGVGSRPYARAVNSQKCIRAGGKHNDLEDVGKDTYHHTFFEMLGNWSFGDYFKEDAIRWAWQLLTEVWGLEPSRLHATVFAGDEHLGLGRDDEAAEIWKRVTRIDPSHIHEGGVEDNFWEMGETGPCGPCSEIHIDLTEDGSGARLVNAGDPRVIELWNLVFIQFNRDIEQDGEGRQVPRLTPLPAQHVDTGMGFERLCAVLQGTISNYATDVFSPLFRAIEQETGAAGYTDRLDRPEDVAYRVIADHLRALVFAIADGAPPSNEGRGYVLRRILRRAVRHGRQTLGVPGPFLYRLVPTVVEQMRRAYPEVKEDPGGMADLIREEEETFGRTLDRGIALFEEAASRAKEKAGEGGEVVIPGKDAFELYATYGFPIDLTQVMAVERGMRVDTEGFQAEMDRHRELSRGGGDPEAQARDSLVRAVQQEGLPATDFVGYDRMAGEEAVARALYARRNDHYERRPTLQVGEQGAVVVDCTPFYAEAGGQVGDTGTIHSRQGGVFAVRDTIRVGETIFHIGELEEGNIRPGRAPFSEEDSLLLEVTQPRRQRTMVHHTATHLLNWALREVLGDHVEQKGSLVDAWKTRFDFSHPDPLSEEEIARIERLVRGQVQRNLPVYAGYAAEPDARRINGLRAVFGEKYPSTVRVVTMGVPLEKLLAKPQKADWRKYPIELCGGTHVGRTAEVGAFRLTAEEGVAKGVRRVTAVGGEAATEAESAAKLLLDRLETLRNEQGEALEQGLSGLSEAVQHATVPLAARRRLQEGMAELQKVAKDQKKEKSRAVEGGVVDHARRLAEEAAGPCIVATIDGADQRSLRSAVDVIRKKRPEAAMLLGTVVDGKVAFVAAVPDPLVQKGLKAGDWVRETAKVVGGGGGGKPDMAQAGGKDPSRMDEALETARRFADETVGS